jgi:hypothetical protein
MTTYFKKKGYDAKWWNWSFVGLAFGLSLIPYAWASGEWILFTIRAVALTVFVPMFCQNVEWDDLEEGGRGFLFCSSLLIFNF